MKTKELVIAVAFLIAGNGLFAQEKMKVDTKKSSIEWEGKKVGGKHNGMIQLESGYLEMQDGKMVSGSFMVDMTSITNLDLKNEGSNQKLVGHLKSDDFFGVETYPTAKFVLSESSEFVNGKASVSGEITIKGKTEKISFDVMKDGDAYSAQVEIDRSKFDVRYGSKSFFNNLGDKAINDIFTLQIKLMLM
jgi:polyisoprenoid-binding protein YceI